MKQIIRITEADLHNIIKESVNKIIKEGFWDNFSPEALDDKAYMDDVWAEREKMMNDDWERRNIAIRKKYPGKSREWYEAMLDTFNENTIKEATAGGGGAGAVGVFSGGQPGNGSGLAGGATTTQNTPQGNGDNTVFGVGLTNKKKKSNTDIINHGRDIYNAKGESKSVPEENDDFFGDTTKRKNGKGGSISIPKHRV